MKEPLSEKKTKIEEVAEYIDDGLDNRDSWFCVLGLLIVHVFYGGILKSFTMFYPFWQVQFNVNNTQVSIIFSSLAASMQLGGFLSKYSAGLSTRIIFVLSATMSFLAAIAASFTYNIYVLAACIGVVGFGLGCFRVRSIGIVNQRFSAEKRSFAISIGMVGTPLGASLMPLLWRFLLDKFTVNQVLLILAGMLAHMFIAALILKEHTSLLSKNDDSRKPDSLKEVFTLPMTLFIIGLFLTLSGKMSQFPYFAPFAESIGLSGYEPANVLVTMSIIDIFGRPLGGVISSTDFVLKYGQSVFCAVFIGSIGLMNIFARQLISDYHSFLVWAACFGLLYALPVSSQMSSLVEFTDVKNTTVVLSMNAMGLLFGVLIMPIINGAIVDATQSFWSTYYFAGGLMLVGTLIMLLAKFLQNKVDKQKKEDEMKIKC